MQKYPFSDFLEFFLRLFAKIFVHTNPMGETLTKLSFLSSEA